VVLLKQSPQALLLLLLLMLQHSLQKGPHICFRQAVCLSECSKVCLSDVALAAESTMQQGRQYSLALQAKHRPREGQAPHEMQVWGNSSNKL